MALIYSSFGITGLSTDTKPTNVPYGIMFFETDTSTLFWYRLSGGWLTLDLDASQVTAGQFAMARLASGTPTGSKFIRDDGVLAVPAGGGGGGLTLVPFTQDLGAARSSGSFDLTGLSGLSVDAPVVVLQTSAPIASKGNARDEGEMDRILATGYVVDATTIRVYWQAPSVVVGSYNFGYTVSA